MDNYTDILEVHDGGNGSGNVYHAAFQQKGLTEEDVHLLRVDMDKAEAILIAYANMDVPRDHLEVFRQQLLTALNAWFVEVADVGLIYLTNIIPTFKADFNSIFWDKKLGKTRRELIKRVIATAIREFELVRVQAFVPVTNGPMAEYELRKIGFTLEGTMRKGWRGEEDVDLLAYGLLKEETEGWEPITSVMTSSARRISG